MTTPCPDQSRDVPLIIIGAGGHARVLLELLRRLGRHVLFLTDLNPSRHGQRLGEIEVLGTDQRILEFSPSEVRLVNGVGSVAAPHTRRAVFERFRAQGFDFDTLIHPSAVVALDAKLGHGVQIMAGAVVQAGVVLGDDVIINTRASVDHDCRVGAHTHIAPGVTLSGNVTVGDVAHIGTSATVIQGIRIGPNAVVGAGSVVIRHVPAGQTVAGVPARPKTTSPAPARASKNTLTIMLSAAGRRITLLRQLRESAEALGLHPRLLASDITQRSAAMHLADLHALVPRYSDPKCFDVLKCLCRDTGVRLIIPTIDPDLPFYARHRERFEGIGTTALVSLQPTIDICNNKGRTHMWLRDNGLPSPRQSSAEKLLKNDSDWTYPLFAKPSAGSSSIGAAVVHSRDELRLLARDADYIVQEIATGVEYTVDVYVDRSGKCRCAVPRLRIETRGGEVVKGMTVRQPQVIDLARRVAEALPGAWGVLNIQIFHDEQTGRSAVIEINPRFGGGYPLSHQAGAHMTRWAIEETLGLPCTAHDDWQDGLVMLRYDEAVFVTREQAGITGDIASAVQNTHR